MRAVWRGVRRCRYRLAVTEQLPVEFCVEVELYEFDGAIGCELADYGESGYERPGHDEEAIVVSLDDQP